MVIDTPGLRRAGLYDIGDGVDLVFADVGDLARGCRFTDCRHGSEPGCTLHRQLRRDGRSRPWSGEEANRRTNAACQGVSTARRS